MYCAADDSVGNRREITFDAAARLELRVSEGITDATVAELKRILKLLGIPARGLLRKKEPSKHLLDEHLAYGNPSTAHCFQVHNNALMMIDAVRM